MLSKIGPEITFEIWQVKYVLLLGLPFSWKIFYFSSVAFAIASSVYSIKCPAIVRYYTGYPDFQQQGKGGREITAAFKAAVTQLSKVREEENVKEFISEFLELFSKTDSKSTPVVVRDANPWEVDIRSDQMAAGFWYVRDLSDKNFPLYRFMATVMYGLGSALLIILLAQNFIYVWRLTF